MKKILLNLHLYGGLLCFSYLIIFGISSLDFNHPFDFTKSTAAPVTWQQTVSLPDLPRITPDTPAADRNAIKTKANEQIRRALNLFGYQSPYQSAWKDPDTYHASLIRPGKTYAVDVHLKDNLAVVTETRQSIWQIINQLHGLGSNMPDSPLVSTWHWYTELCVLTVLFSAASGIYLWTRRKNERRLGLITLTSALLLSLAIMLYITFHG